MQFLMRRGPFISCQSESENLFSLLKQKSQEHFDRDGSFRSNAILWICDK